MRHACGVVGAAVVAVVAVSAAGCLVKESHASLSIEPDGSGTWTVVDRDVHSEADRRAEALNEEREYLAKVETGQHEQALALAEIGCTDIVTEITGRRWPYTVVTEGRFTDLGAVWQLAVEASAMRGRSSLERSGSHVTWRLSIDGEGEAQNGRAGDTEPGPLAVLLADETKVFLGRGRFLQATGFDLSSDGRVATLKAAAIEAAQESTGGVTLALTWTTDGGR